MKNSKNNMRLKSCYTIIPHTANRIELRKGVWNPISFTLEDEKGSGKLYAIMRGLNGSTDINDLAKELGIARAQVEGVVDQLQQLGVMESSPSTFLDNYIEQACPSMMQRLHSKSQLQKNKIIIFGNNLLSQQIKFNLESYLLMAEIDLIDGDHPLYHQLTDADDGWVYNSIEFERKIQPYAAWQDAFVIVAQDIVNPIISSRFNLIAQSHGISWLHGAIDGPALLVGPIFTSEQGPCYHCFETRVAMNLRENANYVTYKQALAKSAVYSDGTEYISAPLVNLLSAHMTMEALNYLATGTGFTKNKVLSIYLPTMEIVFNEVLRLSGCHVCGATEHRDNHQMYFDYQSIVEGVRA